jgi:two-component system, NarL family, response regulator DesR
MIRILIAEDMQMLRRALVALLEIEIDIEVVAELSRGDQIVSQACKVKPDVAVLDIDLPGMDGLTAAAQLRERLPSCRTLILTNLARVGNVRRAVEAHASGFMLKDAEPERLAAAIRSVHAGVRVFDPQLSLATLEVGQSPLTARETDVLRLAANGEDSSQIARQLFLSVGTVRNYLSNIVTKVGARNRIDAIRLARDNGWI